MPVSRALKSRLVILASFVLGSCAPVPGPMSPQPPPTALPGPGVPAAKPPRFDREPQIEVGLRWNLDSLTLIPSRSVPLTVRWVGGERTLGETAAPLRVFLREGALVATWEKNGAITESGLGAGDTLWIGEEVGTGSAAGGGAKFRWITQTWRGRFKIFVNQRQKLTVATRLPLETYLLGVVPGEIGGLAAETMEAGRAQAIAARSYTLFYMGRRAAEGFDVYGSVEDQVYGPVESERELATRCVESTRGQVALSEGRPIRANYCSTCGGITAEVWEAWPADPLPYLVSHRDADEGPDYCAESVHYRWREEWTAIEFLIDVSTFGPAEGVKLPAQGLGDLIDVFVAARSRSGRVARLVIRTTNGDVVLAADQVRRVIRRPVTTVILRSNLIKIGVRRDAATRKALAVVATGAGSGHGVGLCQTGAVAMARRKAPADRILTHYYPGIQLKKLY